MTDDSRTKGPVERMLSHKKLYSGSITDARKDAAHAEYLAESYHLQSNETIRKLKEELARKEKFNAYTNRLIGYLMAVLRDKKILNNQECAQLTWKAKTDIFTEEELMLLQKQNIEAMQRQQQ